VTVNYMLPLAVYNSNTKTVIHMGL